MAKYEVKIKGSISIGGRKFIGGNIYDEKELGNVQKLKGLVKKVEEPKNEMTVKELQEFAEGLEIDELKALLEDEKNGSKRQSAISFLEEKIKELSNA